MRLIDKDALAARLEDECKEWEGESAYQAGLCAAAVIVAEAPIVKRESTIGGWISVKDRLPEISGHYLVSCVTNKTGHRWEVSVNAEWLTSRHEWYIETENCLATAAGVTVTHYMPLPEPPKEDKNVD